MNPVFNGSVLDSSANFPASASSLTNNQFLEVSGLSSAVPPASSQSNLSPSDLLPKDTNSEWSNLNPASNDLKNLNLLSADQVIGINTVSSSCHSTIEPDTYRRSLEIGSKV